MWVFVGKPGELQPLPSGVTPPPSADDGEFRSTEPPHDITSKADLYYFYFSAADDEAQSLAAVRPRQKL